jgi:hypothetical protein
MELALQVRAGDFQIAHGHLGIDVSEQLHHGGETDSSTEHLCAVGVPQLVRDKARGDPGRSYDVSPEIAQFADELVAATGTGQKKAISGC